MSSTDFRVMAVLTEHMGFPPITLIDEVINAVNEIMQKALLGLSDYLKRQRLNQLKQLRGDSSSQENTQVDYEKSGKVFPLEAIELGLVLFDTLCHSHLDKNFDKFELYTLRNILTIPRPLVDEGWVLLKHHEHLKWLNQPHLTSKDTDKQLQTVVNNINKELLLRKILKVQLAKSKVIIASLHLYKNCVDELLLTHANTKLTPELVRVLGEKLDPMNENVYYLLTQVNELVQQVLLLNAKVAAPEAQKLIDGNSSLSLRDAYIEEKTHLLLEKIGLFQERRHSRRSERGI